MKGKAANQKLKAKIFLDADIEDDALSILYAKCKSLECASAMILGAHNKCTFQVTLKANKKVYVATASSALLAKKKAALAAVRDMCTTTNLNEDKPTNRENNNDSRIIVKNMEHILNAIPEKVASNNVCESLVRVPESDALNSNLESPHINDSPSNVTLSTVCPYPENVENLVQHLDNEVPTTSRNAEKYRSAEKRVAGVRILRSLINTNIQKFENSLVVMKNAKDHKATLVVADAEKYGTAQMSQAGQPTKRSVNEPNIQKLKDDTAVMEICSDHEEREGIDEEFSLELNRINPAESSKASSSLDVVDIIEEKQTAIASEEVGHSKNINTHEESAVIDLSKDNTNSIRENTNSETAAVIDVDEQDCTGRSFIPIGEAIDVETGTKTRSVEEIVNECMSQILEEGVNSTDVMEINDDDISSCVADLVPVVENTASDEEAIVKINQETTEDNNGRLTQHTQNTTSPCLEVIEINDDVDEASNSLQSGNNAYDVIEIDNDECATRLVKKPLTTSKAIPFNNELIDISNSPDAMELNENVDVHNVTRSIFTTVKRSVTMSTLDGMRQSSRTVKQNHQVKRLIRNPIGLNNEISKGTQPNSATNVHLPPKQSTPVIKNPISKPNVIYSNLNATHQNQCSKNLLHPSVMENQELFQMSEENVVERLNQICPGISYNLEAETGTSGDMFFLMSATLNDRKYFGNGSTKSEACAEVAKKVLRALNNIIPQLQFNRQEQRSQDTVFNQEEVNQPPARWSDKRPIQFDGQRVRCNTRPQITVFNQQEVTNPHVTPNDRPQISFFNQERNTQPRVRCNDQPQIQFVNQYRRTESQFRCNVNAVPQVWNITQQQPTEHHAQQNIGRYDSTTGLNMCTLSLPQQKADIIETLVVNHFRQVICGNPKLLNYKVLSGIVMTHNLNFENAQVVAIATGAKCVHECSNLAGNGSVVNDAHAEVLARRCLIKYLYTQLRWHSYTEWAEKSIFIRNPSGLQYAFALKPDVQFHLYISTAPCGDARVFSNRGNNEPYGLLRTKVEGGMGTQAIGNRFFSQTLDYINHDNQLLTMSCSDKIARWNVLGIQGSLLSTLVEPIYLYSIVLGSMFNTKHLYRAVCGRLEQKLNFLPKPFHLNRPLLGQTSAPKTFRNNNGDAAGLGMNWTFGDSEIELISLHKGLLINNQLSFLSKQVLFTKYVYLLQHLPNLGISPCPNNYGKAKELARDYAIAKQELFDALQHAGLGCWVKKPLEQNYFTINF